MALQEYRGAVSLEFDGQTVEVVSFDVTHKTGTKVVKTMNRTGNIAGYAKGINEYEMRITVAIPVDKDLDWSKIIDAKLTMYPQEGSGGGVITYTGVCVSEIGDKYTLDKEAARDLTLFAQTRIEE